MSFPVNFSFDGSGAVRTVFDGVCIGWSSAEDKRRFEGYINKNFARVLGKAYDPKKPILDFAPIKFTTRKYFDDFTNAFQGARHSQMQAVLAILTEAGVDLDAIRLDLADEEPVDIIDPNEASDPDTPDEPDQ
jgi:hypothetical protein